MARSVHPGQYLRVEIIDRLSLQVGEAAGALGVTRQALSAVLNGRASVTPDMALRFEKAFGVSLEILLAMQTAHDIALTRLRAGNLRIAPFQPKRPMPPQPNLL